MPDRMLETIDLCKFYADFQALDRITMHLDRGEVVGFLGPNGAGKSTTMKILSGFLAPSGGRALVGGIDLRDDPLACRRQIGYLPQQLPLYPDMTVSAYLDHVARLKGVATSERRREVVDAIHSCRLDEVAKRHIRKLSGGNQQRVGLAQALIGRPPILILDEPTAGLDPTQVANLRGLLNELAERHSILLSTHILGEVEACCSRVVIVDHGQVVLTESVTSLQERTRRLSQVGVRLLDASRHEGFRAAAALAPWCEGAETTEDRVLVTATPEHRAAIIGLAQEHGGLRELVEVRRSLEDVFSEIVAGLAV
jgi:ABC-2 type transport system ATP-binding protein